MADSRTADKFVVRLPDGMRAMVEGKAIDLHTSMNTFVVQAISEKLARGIRQELLLDALERATNQRAHQALQQPRLIGWRTADYLFETADRAVADNWSAHNTMLPIFEGDPVTKLAAPELQGAPS
ncbi:Arc family DNA-binding protein [Pseudomonas sp. SO81]|uniref:Arc family DNA-binding protein n=1 Tax=Pseudomonas sp. SO81 TaxID=2983246 RepID=UPI0025A37255|nr:Arc family DNA-binding protein [Pseudomonas sp. SO81]WJN61321.1 Alginate biosynthesis transcriptional activator [Pseudomonas sp. SO81]